MSSSIVVWQYEGRHSWHDFSSACSAELEQQLQSGLVNTRIKVGRTDYQVDFTSMKQHCVASRSRIRNVRRTDSNGSCIGRLPGSHDDPLSNEFFWAAFQQAMRQVGIALTQSPDEIFDFSRNRDYRGLQDSGNLIKRGGSNYKLPFGWRRFAVKVAGNFDDGDNTWMRRDGRLGEWAVAYHGTKHAYIGSIIANEGLRAGPGQGYQSTCGVGIYCTPDLAVAEGYTSRVAVTVAGQTHQVQFILQCRVRPEAIRKGAESIWVINNPADIRPYGVLVK